MLTGQQWSSKIPTLHGTRTSKDHHCNSKGGQAMKLQTSLPPYIFIADLYNYKNDQIDHVNSRNRLKRGKFSSLINVVFKFLPTYCSFSDDNKSISIRAGIPIFSAMILCWAFEVPARAHNAQAPCSFTSTSHTYIIMNRKTLDHLAKSYFGKIWLHFNLWKLRWRTKG